MHRIIAFIVVIYAYTFISQRNANKASLRSKVTYKDKSVGDGINSHFSTTLCRPTGALETNPSPWFFWIFWNFVGSFCRPLELLSILLYFMGIYGILWECLGFFVVPLGLLWNFMGSLGFFFIGLDYVLYSLKLFWVIWKSMGFYLRNVWFLWDSFGVFGTFLDAAGFRFFLFCGFSSKSLCCMYVADWLSSDGVVGRCNPQACPHRWLHPKQSTILHLSTPYHAIPYSYSTILHLTPPHTVPPTYATNYTILQSHIALTPDIVLITDKTMPLLFVNCSDKT